MTKLISKEYSARNSLKQLKKRAFNDICVLPDLHFESQEKKEVPILLVRQHPLYLALGLIGSFWWFILALIFNIAIDLVLAGQISNSLLLKFKSISIIYGLGISITAAIYRFIKWYYNLFLITSHRIVDLDFNTLSKTSWAEALLTKIEDAEVRNVGFIESLFDLGDVYVQTAGSKDKIEIRRIPKPMKIQDILLDLSQKLKNHD